MSRRSIMSSGRSGRNNNNIQMVDLEEPMEDGFGDVSNGSTTDSCTNQIISHHHHHHHHNHQQQQLLLLQQQQQHHQQQPSVLKRSEMNELIMDYLVHEGFKEAAERFSEEAGIEPKLNDDDIIDKRIEIRQQIEEGNILKGQSLINNYYPELLDNHRDIYFRLQQQHLIELIRHQKINEVLAFVHEHLRVDELSDLSEMERTLALLAYEQPDKSPYAGLLKPAHRLQLASEINDIILQETSGNIEPTKPRLVTLLKLLFWTQNQLEKKQVQFPKMNDLFKLNSTDQQTL